MEDFKTETPATFPEESPETPTDNKSNRRAAFLKAWEFVSELLHVVVISLAIIIPVRYFLIQPFYVKGASMEPNFHDHEYLIIDEVSYRFGDPQRGDIVVFRYPNDPRQYFIKRIVGLSGERIKISDGQITIFNDENPEGMNLDETSYLGPIFTSGDKDIQIGSDEFFLLGDNRGASLDSRSFGPVSDNFIVGRVWIRGWPPEKFGVFGEQDELYK
jgi:signal peptidase I